MSDEMRGIEMSFAYERAGGVIESECVCVEPAGSLENGWYDLETADIDIEDEIRYLDSRRLLQRHPQHPSWVIICDEGEPIEEMAK